uniref:uncharacterized protein LOC122592059 n=1 Tax=Erigeron canadensis TaxID=72917 RepID=UPI001CB8E866|nr:uncharacterized protein LOC122592059 [Erigeron canadensis]
MAVRSKRVSDPLDERVKDRIMGRDMLETVCGGQCSTANASQIDHCYSSSSSTSRSLSYLVNCFEEDVITDKVDDGCHIHENDSDSDSDFMDAKQEEMNSTLHNINGDDHFRNILLANVTKAIEIFRPIITSNTQILNRNVTLYLQNLGYNAAICKTKWESSCTAGNHEFIDVIRTLDNINVRYLIDLNFAQEFHIARQTKHLQRLSNKLPVVFVGKSEDLKVIVKLMCDEIKRSLKSRGLFVPPWRKNRFMQNKWFGPYRRTANLYTLSSKISVPINNRISSSIKCNSMVGFQVVDSVSLVHAASRTR